jgi:hypothetical protein
VRNAKRIRCLRYDPYKLTLLALGAGLVTGCGPRAHIPPRPVSVPGALSERDSVARLARALAPLLYLQVDEWFPLERVVAVVHPARRIVGYHLLWRDDVHGSWIPFTVPTDQEIVWVGYDGAARATDLWTFWHGTILHADWRGRGLPQIDVQWGKHGSLPRGIIESDLPRNQKLNAFYFLSWFGLPDIWLSNLTRPGPWCFCRGYGRYRDFSTLLSLSNRIDVVVQTADPTDALAAVFGTPFSRKRLWPFEGGPVERARVRVQ